MGEADIVAPLVGHFEGLGFHAATEVFVAGRRADLVAVSRDELVAVEAKVVRWRQAVHQAIAYQVWADWSYVALPFACAFRAFRDRHRFEGERVGLLAVLGTEVRAFLPAGRSPRRFPPLSDHVRRALRADGQREGDLH